MEITKKFRRAIALVVCVAVMVMNTVLPVYPIIYAMNDTVHDAVYYEGGETEGGETENGETENGETEDGETESGETENGETEDGETEGGETEGGETEDGETEDGETEDGDTEDGDTEDGDTESGDTEDGETEDGEIEDSEIEEEMETEEALLTLYDGAEVDTVWYTVYAGDQTFSIETEAELRGLAYLVNEENVLFAGKTIELVSNIELTEAIEWKPIGSSYVADGGFQGTFDGAGHTVSGLTINEAGQYKGLFGFVNGATITNLTLSGAITQGGVGSFGFIGGIAGRSTGTTKIEDCTSEVAITITNPSAAVNYIGGIVGLFPGGTVKGCMNDADISIQGGSAVNRIGGILGYASGQTKIDSCVNEGEIVRTANNGTNIGGLVGEAGTSNSSLTIMDSHNANEVTSESTSTSNYTGGLVGNGGASLSITGSHNSGPVNSRSGYTGGLVGYAGNNPKITDSCNTGDVTITGSSNTSYIGGVAGSVGTTSATVLERVYNTGAVQVQSTGTGSNYTGGVAGFVAPGQAGSSITECHNTGNITGGNYTGGVFGSLGASLGNITYCYNTGEVATNGQIAAGIVQGGVAGSAGDNTYLSYCYNTGGITSTEASITAVGGITGRNGTLGSYVSSGFNIGKITAANYTNVGGITSVNYASNEKVYYAKSIVNDDIAVADANRAEGVETAQATNGWLAYMLDDGRKSYFRTTCWSQGDEYPVFADNGDKPVYKVTLTELEEGATIESDSGEYVKQDESVTLTITPPAGKILSLVTVRGARGKQSVNIDDDGQAAVTAEFAMPGGDVTVTAAFVETPTDPAYTVTYHANDSSGNDATDTRQVAAGKRAESFDPDDLGFTNSGHTFEYWSLTDNGPEYDFNTAVVENIDLYAIWRADGTWRVTFNLSGSIGDPPPPLFVGSGETVDKPSPDPIWESGDEVEMYVFDKWCKEDGEAWNFATDTVTGDITLYAEWKIGNIFAQSSEENPAVVGSEYALRYLSSLVNSGQQKESVYVSVYNDITLAGEWVPIGVDAQNVFTGAFDGGGYTISGVKVTEGTYAGLFGYAKDAVIKNITVEGSISTSTYSSYTGGIAGYADGVTFENCSNGASVSSARNAGGIVAEGQNVTLNGCENRGTIKHTSTSGTMGGIAGYASLKAPAENLINTGDVTSANTAGGIFGNLSGSYGVSKLYNIGNVESSIIAGGIIGTYGPTSTIEMCYNLGDISINPMSVSSYNAVGGIVGSKPESAKIASCYSMGKITAKTIGGADIAANVGGIVGSGSVNIESCYFLKGDDGRTYSDEGSTRSVPLSADAFESGEAAWRLDKGAMASRTYNWSQDNGHPIFATNENRPVYRMSVKSAADGNGKVGPEGVSYYCESSQVALTIAPGQGYALASLAIADSTGRRYTANIKNNTAAFNMPAANITVTPAFMNAADIGEGPFTVSFHLNGGTGAGVDPQTVDGGEWAQQPSPNPTREGYIFAGWYDKAELDLVGWYNFLACEPFDFNTAIIKDMEFVACWLPRNAVVVSFDLNRGEDAEGSKPIPPQIVLYGEKIKRPADNPTWDIGSNLFEMVFNNWFDQASEGTAWDFETSLSAEYGNALTLYAQWNKKLGDNPVIDNIDDLEELALNIKNGVAEEGYKGVKLELSGNITLKAGWIGLGTSNYPFNGTLSGGNITLDPNQTQPFFGYLGEEGTVSGVTVTGTLNSTPGDFGGIAGTSEGTIRDCNVKLIIESPNTSVSNVGGIVGYASGGKIAGCTLLNGSIITGMQMVGGIVGNANGTEIIGCKTEDGTQVIGSSRKIGGIAGVLWYSVGDTSVTGCVNNANVGSGSEAGGIAGGAGNTESSVSLASANVNSLTITDCVNNGEITGNRYLGGIVGRMGGGADRTIEECVNRGAVTAGSTVLAHVGGIIGHTYNIAPSITYGGYDVYENIDINLLGCENYGDITGNTPPSQVIQNIGGLIGLLAPGIKLTVTDCKVGGSREEDSVTVGANSESLRLHTIGGLIGRVEIGQVGANEKRFATDVSVSDSSFHGRLNGDPTYTATADASFGALGGVIGSITSSASADGAPPRQVAIDSVRVDADMSGNSFRIGGVIGRLNGLDANTAYTLTNISVEGDMPDTNTTAETDGALGGIIGQMASFAGTLEVSGSYWKGNFTDAADLPHGGVIGDMGPIAATADVNITCVFMRGDFSGDTNGGTGGIIGNITSLADGASVALENAYWYGAGINPDNGKEGGIIGNIDENNGSLTVGNTYYGFSDGTEPAEESFTSYEGNGLDDGITFKSKADFERGEVSYLLMEGAVTDARNMAAIASDGVTWEQDWKNKYPVFGEHRTHRITSTLFRQDSEGQLTPEPDASLVITAKSPGSPSETAYDDFGGSVEVSVVDIPEGYTVESISIAGGSPESIGNNGTFTLDGDAQVTAIIGEAPPEPPPPDEDEDDDEDEDPEDDNNDGSGKKGSGKKGSGSGTGDGTGGDGDGLTPGGDSGLSGDTGALYPLPDGDTPAGSGETEGTEKASSPVKDETLPESFVVAQQPESAETSSSLRAAPPVEEQEPDETTESNVEGGADDEFAQGGPADESENEPKAESDATGTLEAIEDVVKSNLPLIIAVAIVVAVITAVSGFLRYRKKRNSDDNIGM